MTANKATVQENSRTYNAIVQPDSCWFRGFLHRAVLCAAPKPRTNGAQTRASRAQTAHKSRTTPRNPRTERERAWEICRKPRTNRAQTAHKPHTGGEL